MFLSSQLNLQHSLKLAEEQTVGRNASLMESDEAESLEHLKVELERREKILRATEEERDTLMSELEELDRQNQEATQVCSTAAPSSLSNCLMIVQMIYLSIVI